MSNDDIRPILKKIKKGLLQIYGDEVDRILLYGSRAYYSLFYTAEALLLSRGLSFSSHSAVIANFGKEFAKTGILNPKFHHYLTESQDRRNIGDYSVLATVTKEEVRENWPGRKSLSKRRRTILSRRFEKATG